MASKCPYTSAVLDCAMSYKCKKRRKFWKKKKKQPLHFGNLLEDLIVHNPSPLARSEVHIHVIHSAPVKMKPIFLNLKCLKASCTIKVNCLGYILERDKNLQ